MRKVLLLALFLGMFLPSAVCPAQTVPVFLSCSNLLGVAAPIYRIELTPLFADTANPNYFQIPDPIILSIANMPSLTNGYAATNLAVGWVYGIDISSYSQVPRKNVWLPETLTNMSGPFNLAAYQTPYFFLTNGLATQIAFEFPNEATTNILVPLLQGYWDPAGIYSNNPAGYQNAAQVASAVTAGISTGQAATFGALTATGNVSVGGNVAVVGNISAANLNTNILGNGTNGTGFMGSGGSGSTNLNIAVGGAASGIGNPGYGGTVNIAGGGTSANAGGNAGTVYLAKGGLGGYGFGPDGNVIAGNLYSTNATLTGTFTGRMNGNATTATTATNLAGNILASQVMGALTNNQTGLNLSGTFTGNGSGLTNTANTAQIGQLFSWTNGTWQSFTNTFSIMGTAPTVTNGIIYYPAVNPGVLTNGFFWPVTNCLENWTMQVTMLCSNQHDNYGVAMGMGTINGWSPYNYSALCGFDFGYNQEFELYNLLSNQNQGTAVGKQINFSGCYDPAALTPITIWFSRAGANYSMGLNYVGNQYGNDAFYNDQFQPNIGSTNSYIPSSGVLEFFTRMSHGCQILSVQGWSSEIANPTTLIVGTDRTAGVGSSGNRFGSFIPNSVTFSGNSDRTAEMIADAHNATNWFSNVKNIYAPALGCNNTPSGGGGNYTNDYPTLVNIWTNRWPGVNIVFEVCPSTANTEQSENNFLTGNYYWNLADSLAYGSPFAGGTCPANFLSADGFHYNLAGQISIFNIAAGKLGLHVLQPTLTNLVTGTFTLTNGTSLYVTNGLIMGNH